MIYTRLWPCWVRLRQTHIVWKPTTKLGERTSCWMGVLHCHICLLRESTMGGSQVTILEILFLTVKLDYCRVTPSNMTCNHQERSLEDDFPRWFQHASVSSSSILFCCEDPDDWINLVPANLANLALPKERTSLNSFEKRLPVVLLENSVNALLSAARASIRGSGCFFDEPRGSARGVQLPWLTPRNRGKGSVLVLQCASVACATWPFFMSILTVGPSNGKDIWSRLDVLWC